DHAPPRVPGRDHHVAVVRRAGRRAGRAGLARAAHRVARAGRLRLRAGGAGDLLRAAGRGGLMELFVVGISWRTAPVAVREKLAVPDDEAGGLLEALRATPAVREAMLISTCNRVEIYGASAPGEGDAAVAAVKRLLPENRGVRSSEVGAALYGH